MLIGSILCRESETTTNEAQKLPHNLQDCLQAAKKMLNLEQQHDWRLKIAVSIAIK
jgi:hypothetical protein